MKKHPAVCNGKKQESWWTADPKKIPDYFREIQGGEVLIMASQPTPPNVPPPRNKALLRAY